MVEKKLADLIEKAGEAHTDVSMFAAIEALCQSGCFHSDTHGATQRIINICQIEQQRCLRRYDAAVAAIADARRKDTP